MKFKKLKIILVLFVLLVSGCSKQQIIDNVTKIVKFDIQLVDKVDKNNYVSYNGWLKLENNKLVNQYGEKISLRGISSHGIQWFGDLITNENLTELKKWGSNVFRIAMYTEQDGYLANPSLKNKVYEIVELAKTLDMYVIIDWHILYDNNPMNHINEAKVFFDEVSKKYADVPNVIFEICNEPNGNTNWDNDIYSYAEEIIKIIRNNNKKAIVIVGTPTWSQDVDKVVNKPLSDNLVMYALHFYAGTHKQELRDRVKNVINKIPLIVSEWGTSDASGTNGNYFDESKNWLEFLEENNISWINWSLTNKNETSAILKENTYVVNDENLTESGLFIKSQIEKY